MPGDKVYIKKIGNMVILLSIDNPLLKSLDQFSGDFMEERQQPPQQNRKNIFGGIQVISVKSRYRM